MIDLASRLKKQIDIALANSYDQIVEELSSTKRGDAMLSLKDKLYFLIDEELANGNKTTT